VAAAAGVASGVSCVVVAAVAGMASGGSCVVESLIQNDSAAV
jgi:hypothetical protein